MNKRLIVFNLAFYFITLLLYSAARHDQSSSLGYGFLIPIFWAAAFFTLIILLATKKIKPTTVLDKIGVVMATPLLSIIIALFTMASVESPASESHFDDGNHRYKVVKFDFRASGRTKRIEYYKGIDTISPNNIFPDEKWMKDSTWVYFSESGDTLKTVRYRDDVEVK